ncbi:Myo-inositol transporter 1, partial [Termitomyces sp. J132]
LIGIGMGPTACITPLYIQELSPTHHCGRIVVLNVIMIALGQAIAYEIGAGFKNITGSWRWIVGLSAVPADIQCLLLYFLPKSSHILICRSDMVYVHTVISRIYALAQLKEVKLKVKMLHEAFHESIKITNTTTFIQRFNCTLGDVEFEQDQRLCRERQEWTMNPTPSISATVYSPSPIPDSPSGSVLVPNTGTRSRTPTSPDANALTNTNTDKDTSADGHTFFCPAAPSPIELVMVPRSSFSSLRGWDGVDCEEGSAGEMGLGQRHGHAQEAWFGLGRMQSVGLGLGGEEEGEVGGCEW